VDPQIVVKLLVDRTGFPLEIGCYEGNTAETTTIVPIITSFIEHHGLNSASMVVAADASMLSASNLKALDALGSSFIVGSRTTKAPRGSGVAFPLERWRFHRWASHRHRHTPARQHESQRPRPTC
jgi:transposase